MTDGFIPGCFLGLFAGAFICIYTGCTVNDANKRNAIEAGVAEYIVNPKTGETAFQYIKVKREEIK